jgi:RNA polymerase sigma factor (sigma-70 family)
VKNETVETLSLPLSDAQLIEGCLRNDSGSWEALIRRYQNLIYSVPIKYRFPLQDSSDIFQSVCLILMEKLKTLRNTETLSSWLYTTTRRQCWKFARKRSREVELEDQAGGAEDPSGDLLLLQHELKNGLEQLSGKCRDLLTALYFAEPPLSYEEIVVRLEIPLGSIGPTRARCLAGLKKLMTKK